MGKPAVINLDAYQGDRLEVFFRVRNRSFNEQLQMWVPGDYVNLTGWTAKGHVKASKSTVDPLTAFEFTISDQAITPGGVTAYLTPDKTALLTAEKYLYDIQLTNGPANVITYLAGEIRVTAEVTRGV